MRITVCQLNDDPDGLARDWDALVAHVRAKASELVLLPEMPFHPWFARTRDADPAVWDAGVAAHEAWLARLPELAPATVLGSRPVNANGKRLNEGFVWEPGTGYRAAHAKYYLPDDEGYWESAWYERGDGKFDPVECRGARAGFLICTELWFMQRARAYGKAGAEIIACPRTTGRATVEKWLVAGRASAVVAGAYCLSSNRINAPEAGVPFGGQGWVVSPDGEVLGLTSERQPFVTVAVDLAEARAAKATYPRYVPD